MSDISHFFRTIDLIRISEEIPYQKNQFGNLLNIYQSVGNFPDLEETDIVLIGVCEDRYSINNVGARHPDAIRKYLYRLYPGSFNCRIADLGNILPGFEVEDTYFALSESIQFLVKKGVIPFILGGSQDLTYAQFRGYEKLEQTINMVTIDSDFDLGNPEEKITNKSFLGKIILHQPNFLFNYSQIGYQTYLVDPGALNMMSKLFFDTYRLGEIRDNIQEAEPIIRHADMLSFDISCLKHADAPAHAEASANGFYSEEACQMMRYAGMNDKLSSIGIYEFNPHFDVQGKTASLIAQMFWCFLDGYYYRKKDFPTRTSADYTRFHVFLQENKYEINFYKSNKSDRWWMEVPYPNNEKLKFERHTLIPCSFRDYEIACKDEIPDRWWQTFQKLC